MKWLIDKILQVVDTKVKIKVLVHEGFFIEKNRELYYFVKITNLSPQNIFTITHVWVKDKSKEIEIINPARPLPHKLSSSDTWETWFSKDIIEDKNNVFKKVRVVLSNGKTYKSEKNIDVRPAGFVA